MSSQKEHKLEKCKLKAIDRSVAYTEAQNVISTFALRVSAAIRETDPAQQIILVEKAAKLLTKSFSIIFRRPDGSIISEIHDFNSLLAGIQGQATATTFDSNLVGNFSLKKISRDKCGHCSKSITLHVETLQYIIQTLNSGVSVIMVGSYQYVLVGTIKRGFKIKSIVATILTTIPIPPLLPEPIVATPFTA